MPIVIDSGVRHGADIAVSIVLGADMAFIGRPYVYAVAAAGPPFLTRRLRGDKTRRQRQDADHPQVLVSGEVRVHGRVLAGQTDAPRKAPTLPSNQPPKE